MKRRIATGLLFMWVVSAPAPAAALGPDQLAVIVNTADPYSVEVGEYYARRRRNTRAAGYAQVEATGPRVRVDRIDADELRDRSDVLFYFTGRVAVSGLETLRFRPGAIADHLTSTGGVLTGHDQMSALRWLEAGATASYGTVVEPCNFRSKFPQPAVVIDHYTQGETLIEAYWKSVAAAGQGVFVGEPLAAPFRARPP